MKSERQLHSALVNEFLGELPVLFEIKVRVSIWLCTVLFNDFHSYLRSVHGNNDWSQKSSMFRYHIQFHIYNRDKLVYIHNSDEHERT